MLVDDTARPLAQTAGDAAPRECRGSTRCVPVTLAGPTLSADLLRPPNHSHRFRVTHPRRRPLPPSDDSDDAIATGQTPLPISTTTRPDVRNALGLEEAFKFATERC
jgi:hypothetical protein